MQQPPPGSGGYGYPPPQQPFQPPQQPPQPRRSKRRLWMIVAIIAGLVLVSCIGCGVLSTMLPKTQANTSAETPTANSTQTPVSHQAPPVQPTTAPTSAPTLAPTPTSAPTQTPSGIPATHGTPRLGGPLSDFIGAYGQPNGHSTPPQFHFLTVNNIDEFIISGVGSSCSSLQCEGQQQVDDISVQSPDQTNGYSISEAEARCMAFAPSDAHFKQKFPYADNSGFDMVYTSATLAREFPASEFSDGNGGTVPPGTFDVSYLYSSNGQGIGSCDMITGEQQTHN